MRGGTLFVHSPVFPNQSLASRDLLLLSKVSMDREHIALRRRDGGHISKQTEGRSRWLRGGRLETKLRNFDWSRFFFFFCLHPPLFLLPPSASFLKRLTTYSVWKGEEFYYPYSRMNIDITVTWNSLSEAILIAIKKVPMIDADEKPKEEGGLRR